MKITDEKAIIVNNEQIADKIYRMVLKGAMAAAFEPGQFVNIKIDGLLLRRPISISEYSVIDSTFTIVYKLVGEGTERLASMKPNQTLEVLGPLGTGFPMKKAKSAMVIGGGVGIPPLLQTTRELMKHIPEVVVVLGFPTKTMASYIDLFQETGAKVYVTTEDGTIGFKGNVMELIEKEKLTAEYVYACGPEGMLRAVEKRFPKGFLSFEARMACGIGACMACVCKDQSNPSLYYRICKEGPVFEIGKVGLEQ